MATIARTLYPLPELCYGKDFDSTKHDAAFRELQDRSDALPEGEIVGALLSFPHADGYAHYLVTKERPLTLQPVPYMDAWQLPYFQIRGIRRQDVLSQLDWRRRMLAVFGKEKGGLKR